MEVEYDYEAELADELTIHSGDIIASVRQMSGGWWEGTLKGKKGLFPENFVKVISVPANHNLPQYCYSRYVNVLML